MFNRFLYFCIGLGALFVSCTTSTPNIHTLCMRDEVGNYLVKWEIDPEPEGMAQISISDNPDNFDNKNIVIYAPIKDGVATYITNENITRKYFRLTFNNKYPQIVGARSTMMDSVQNFRDIGGYLTSSNKMIRWGKVYRSGDISHMTLIDSLRISSIGIKTIIDMRSSYEMKTSPIRYKEENTNVMEFPLTVGNYMDIQPFLIEGRFLKGDAVVYMQDLYLKFISDNSDIFEKILPLFLEKENYPILLNCPLGKDASGFLTMLLLASLSVPEETIIQDYLASNEYIIISHFGSFALQLSPQSQEAITVFLSANEDFINPLLLKIRRDYGTMDHFLDTTLNFTEKERNKLKDMLLY